MEGKPPKVSVRIPSYNHAKYLRACMDSVFSQTFQDFEVVVTDDGSSDDSVEILRSYTDPRLRLNVFPQNRGSASAIEDCLLRARGEYIANLCSDDLWEPDKLEKQVRYLDTHPEIDAVLTRVQWIGEEGEFLPDSACPAFRQPNRSSDEWLRYFFYTGNALCMPSAMLRKNIYDRLVYQDKRMTNLNDFDLWIRLCMDGALFILDERLTRFRLRANKANLSGGRPETRIRCRFEYKQALHHFLYISSAQRLLSIFPECVRYGQPTDEAVPYFLARLAYDTGIDFKQLWGLETLFRFLGNEDNAAMLLREYGFAYNDFYRMTGAADVFRLRGRGIEELVRKAIAFSRSFTKRR